MSNIRNILVNYNSGDNIESVLDSIVALTKGYESAITFAYINEKINGEAKATQKKLQDMVSARKLSPDRIKYILKEGKPYVEIINIARQQPTDTIIMRVAPKAPIFNLFNEDNPYRAVISAPCPVITLSKNVKLEKVQHILMPIDDTERTRQKLPIACNIAKHFGATIHLLALCEETSGETKVRMQHYAEQSKRYVEEKGIKTSYDVVLGHKVCHTVLEYEEKSKADLVIITADEDTSFLFESCFEKVISKSTIPVMSVPAKDTKVTWAGL